MIKSSAESQKETPEEAGKPDVTPGKFKQLVDRAYQFVPQTIPMSHKRVGLQKGPELTENEPFLTSENHGSYVGKIMKEEGMYSGHFVKASLQYLFENLVPGQEAQIFYCSVFSEYFNGQGDKRLAIPDEKAVKLIYKTAVQLGKKKDDLQVVQLQDVSLHKDFFAALKSSFDEEKGMSDIEKAFGSEEEILELHRNPSSLQIARFLYAASKKNPQLFQFFRKGAAEKIRSEPDDPPCSKDYYSMGEISLRLAEILNGRFIHGGADKQAYYDDFIEAIVKIANPKSGKKIPLAGPFEGLDQLVELFKGKHFETLHLKTDKNPYAVQIDKHRAKARLYIIAALAGIVALSPAVGAVVVHEIKKAERAANLAASNDAAMSLASSELKGHFLKHESMKWHSTLPPGPERDAANLRSTLHDFHEMVMEGLNELHVRYGLTKEQTESLYNAFQTFLSKQKGSLASAGDDYAQLVDLVDKFMHDDLVKATLADNGIKAEGPYSNLAAFSEKLLETSKLEQLPHEIGVTEGEVHFNQIEVPFVMHEKTAENLKSLGKFTPPESMSNYTYEIYVYTSNSGQQFIYAKKLFNEQKIHDPSETSLTRFKRRLGLPYAKITPKFIWNLVRDEIRRALKYKTEMISRENGIEAAKQYVLAMRRYAFMGLSRDFKDDVHRMCGSRETHGKDVQIALTREVREWLEGLPREVRNKEVEKITELAAGVTETIVLHVEDFSIDEKDVYEKVIKIKDPFGEFAYDVTVVSDFVHDEGSDEVGYKKHFVAKYPDEKVFTTSRAREVGNWWERIRMANWSYPADPNECLSDPYYEMRQNGKKKADEAQKIKKTKKKEKYEEKVMPPFQPGIGPFYARSPRDIIRTTSNSSQRLLAASYRIPGGVNARMLVHQRYQNRPRAPHKPNKYC